MKDTTQPEATPMIPNQEMIAEGWKDSKTAFEQAINEGRLSRNPQAENYAGHFMYMGPGKGGDAFKHIVTRQYLTKEVA